MCVCVCVCCCVQLFETPWTVAHQAPLSMGFPRQENWSGLPFPSPGDLPGPGIKFASPTLASGFFTSEPPGKQTKNIIINKNQGVGDIVCGLVAQLCLTLCNPLDSSPPGSSVHGIFQARILECVATSFSKGSSRARD